jgi:cyclohexanecarboxyl-CoA dehydrogenase
MIIPFQLGAEYEDFRAVARRFFQESFADSMLKRAMSEVYPREELMQIAARGMTALLVPEPLGGQGSDALALGIACEEAGYADFTVANLVFYSNLVTDMLVQHASTEVQEIWLPGVIVGDTVVSVALTEPGSGSDAAAMRTRAERVPGGWCLTGEKTSITQAVHADAAIVIARSDPAPGGRAASAFLVPLDDPTISTQRFADPGFRPLGRGSITMDGTFVPDANVLGEVNRGFQTIMKEFDLSRTLIGLMVVGTAQRALDMTAEYVTQRETFGKPIGAYQGVSFPLAEHTTYVEAARLLAYHTLVSRTAGQPHTALAAMVKWWNPEVAFNAIKDCIILHGHMGWSDEMPLQAMLRDVSGTFIGDGTPQIQKLIIARELLGRDIVDR